jgi:hypothetical protein
MHIDLWVGPFKDSEVTANVRNVRRLGPNYLLADLDLTLRGAHGVPLGGRFDRHGAIRTHLKHILEKRGMSWKIVSAQNTFMNVE